jgi:hypothetical protein
MSVADMLWGSSTPPTVPQPYARDPLAERTWMLVGEWGVATCMKCGMWLSYKREHRERLPITCNACDPTPLAGT